MHTSFSKSSKGNGSPEHEGGSGYLSALGSLRRSSKKVLWALGSWFCCSAPAWTSGFTETNRSESTATPLTEMTGATTSGTQSKQKKRRLESKGGERDDCVLHRVRGPRERCASALLLYLIDSYLLYWMNVGVGLSDAWYPPDLLQLHSLHLWRAGQAGADVIIAHFSSKQAQAQHSHTHALMEERPCCRNTSNNITDVYRK